MKLLVLCHDRYSLPARVGQCFVDRGFDLTHHVVVEDSTTPVSTKPFPDVTDHAAVVAMGAPWSVYDHATVGTWIGRELMLLREAHTLGVPILGICFGAQALASALGGSVSPAAAPEVGWSEVESDVPGHIAPGPWFQWHEDLFSLPREAGPSATVELARNATGPQAFRSQRSLGVQFHPEIDAPLLATWIDNGGAGELQAIGADPDELLTETQALEGQTAGNVVRLVDFFLEDVAATKSDAEAR